MNDDRSVNIKEHCTEYPTRLLYMPNGTERIGKLGFLQSFPKNHIIIKPGAVPEYCYIVKKGRVVAYEFTTRGEERVYNFLEESALFLDANLLTNVPAKVYFKTAMQSELICIDRKTLLQAMENDSVLVHDIIESISDKFFSSMDQIREASSHNSAWKVCNLLIIFAHKHGIAYDGKILIKEKISQQMLSNLLGINRITTVRIIKHLKDLNHIELINGYYCIRDIEKLAQHMEYLSLHDE